MIACLKGRNSQTRQTWKLPSPIEEIRRFVGPSPIEYPSVAPTAHPMLPN